MSKIGKHIGLVALISDDLAARISPICKYLKTKYDKIYIFAYDIYPGRYDYSSLKNELRSYGYDVKVFSAIRGGIDLMNDYNDCDMLFLIKHSQITYRNLVLFYIYFRVCAPQKWIIRSNILLVRKVLASHDTTLEAAYALYVAVLHTILYSLFYIGSILIYYLFFMPLTAIATKRNGESSLSREYHNILVIRMDHLGDIICTLPALSALREHYPNSKVTFLGASWSCEPLKANRHLYDELIIWDAPWHNKNSKDRSGLLAVIKMLRFVPQLKKRKYDLVIQPRGEGINVALAALSGGQYVVSGLDPRFPLAALMSNRIDSPVVFNPYRTYHISEWSSLSLKKIGIEIQEKHIRECYQHYPDPTIEEAMQSWKAKNYRLCSLVIGAGAKARDWNTEKFAKLVQYLFKMKIVSVLIGSKKESARAQQIMSLAKVPVVDMVSKTDFQNITSILHNSHLVISLDTSIMHLASLLGNKIIALFSSGNVNLAKPVYSDFILVKKELGCSGCGDICMFGNRYPCIHIIGINDVVKHVL